MTVKKCELTLLFTVLHTLFEVNGQWVQIMQWVQISLLEMTTLWLAKQHVPCMHRKSKIAVCEVFRSCHLTFFHEQVHQPAD